MSEVQLRAPLAGWLTPLEELPDPVFAQRMMGDGLAIDPTEGALRAPADGVVVAIPETAHAVTLRLANGAEILIHIGLDTVALGGRGFDARVGIGETVKAGDLLIVFDLDAVGRSATSLVTPLVLVSEGGSIEPETTGRLVAPGDVVARVSGGPAAAAPLSAPAGPRHERTAVLGAPHGIHARPAARLAALLKRYDAAVTLRAGSRSADARSTVAMLALGARHGDAVTVEAVGPEAAAAAEAAADFIASGMGDGGGPAPAPSAAPAAPGHAVCAVPGLAIGAIHQLRSTDRAVPHDGQGIAAETAALAEAVESLRSALARESGTGGIMEAHLALLDDPTLAARARAEIDSGRSAALAWRLACAEAREAIRATGDPLLAERAADLLDIERRVIAALLGEEEGAGVHDIPADAILVSEDLLPSQFLALDRGRVAGICTAGGGPTSHVAVLAASADIPMIVAAGRDVLDLADGTPAVLDGAAASLEPNPDEARLREANAALESRRAARAADASAAHAPCRMADGTRIEIFANLGSAEDAADAVAAAAEGCGLLRTEFLFLDRDEAPGEEEQYRLYARIADLLGDRPLVVRTLDIGGDKPVAYLPSSSEENPALGCRGIRLSLARPDMLEVQLRAILRAVPGARCRIMLPMIVDLGEYRQARILLDRAAAAVGRVDPVSLGVMIETPAAAVLADTIAAEADFLSVGTNDLTQYALAADRGNPAVSAKIDAFHPAVLRLIRAAGDGARAHRRWLGVCGGLASDPLAAALLIGLGVTELSATSAAIPGLKAQVRRLSVDGCTLLAERACAAASAAEVRAIAKEAMA